MLANTNKISSMVIIAMSLSEFKRAREPAEISTATKLLTTLELTCDTPAQTAVLTYQAGK